MSTTKRVAERLNMDMGKCVQPFNLNDLGIANASLVRTLKVLFLVVVTLSAQFIAAEQAKFTAGPTVSKSGGKVAIGFTVSAPTDVAVYIEDSKGNVVRHLIAGVLGDKAPAPLKPGLTQNLEWDGKDDDERHAENGPFKVRVGLGLKPEFDSFLVYDPDRLDDLQCLACCPDGGAYVFYRDAAQNFFQGGTKIKVYDRDGHRDRMLMPFAADVPYDRVKPMGTFQDEKGRLIPRIHSWETLNFYPDTIAPNRGRSLVSAPAVDSKGNVHWQESGRILASLAADGGALYSTFLSKPLFDPGLAADGASLAVGEGDRYLYFSNVGKMNGNVRSLVPCIFRMDLATRDSAVPFIGTPDGEVGKPLTAPGYIACAKGILYVVDAGRIAAFNEKDGSLAGEIKVESACYVGVDAASGAVYVVCKTPMAGDVVQPDLVKFDGIKTGKEICRVKLPKDNCTREVRHRISVDNSQKKPRIWVELYTYQNTRFVLVDDEGANLTVHDEYGRKGPFTTPAAKDLLMDRKRGELYFEAGEFFRYNEATGEIAKVKAEGGVNWMTRELAWCGGQLVCCEDGNLVSMGNGRGLFRWTRDGKPLPWTGSNDHTAKPTGITTTIMTLGPPGSLAAHKDEIYIVSPHHDGSDFSTSVNVHGMDGKVKRTAIWQCTVRAIPRVDANGNIYLAEAVKPKGHMHPEFFDNKRPDLNWKEYDPYNYIYGGIIKFPKSGGVIWYDKTLPKPAQGPVPEEILKKPAIEISYPGNYCRGLREGTIQGADWVRFGFAPYSLGWNIGTAGCHCENAGFDVDAFGRVFYPNLGMFRVEMVDTDNNFIGTFGHYGNQDSGGKDARVKVPEIPFAWPVYVAVSDKYAYIADTINLRVVKVKLGYTVQFICDVK